MYKYVNYLRFCKIQVDLTNLPILPKFLVWCITCPIPLCMIKILETLITFYTVHLVHIEFRHWCMMKIFRIWQIRQPSFTAFCKTSIKCDQVTEKFRKKLELSTEYLKENTYAAVASFVQFKSLHMIITLPYKKLQYHFVSRSDWAITNKSRPMRNDVTELNFAMWNAIGWNHQLFNSMMLPASQ